VSAARSGLLGGVEAGGTKFVLVAGPTPHTITHRAIIPTEAPGPTLARVADWFAAMGGVAALGIASFGPVDRDPASPTWGRITRTPKPGWSDCDLVGPLGRALGVPVGFETDVNAAAMAEHAALGAAAPAALAYVTVGTGIGGGCVIDGVPVNGVAHPEMGHILPRRAADDRDFAGICPYHGDCLEGLACGPAIRARWGVPLSELPPDHVAHARVADYLAQLCHTLFATMAVADVVLGGGVMKTPGLLARVAMASRGRDNDYLPGRAHHQVRASRLGDDAGAVGALLLAARAASDARTG
jgi:fructokinase